MATLTNLESEVAEALDGSLKLAMVIAMTGRR